MSETRFTFWVVMPAAGRARRMGDTTLPKQYLPLGERTVIEHALAPFLASAECAGVVVALADDDRRWTTLPTARDARVSIVVGGAERSDSVRAGLAALKSHLSATDWVLVHDAARPCLSAADLKTLLNELKDDDVGGLLAAPVVDTLKRASSGRVAQTVDRESLWHALTPQMFRYGILVKALEREGVCTDESQAVEHLGLQPKIVRGSIENLKVTVPEDLVRAERILRSRGNS